MLIASLCSACMSGFAKALSANMDTIEVVFFRNFVGVVLVLLTLIKNPIRQKGGRPFLLLFRGTIGFLALVAWFYNVAHISLADAITFSNTAPIFTALFSFIFLSERIGVVGWFAIFLGFLGLIFIIKPDGLSMSYYHILGIFSGVGGGLAYTSIRELRKHYDTRSIVLSFMGVGTLGPILLSLAPTSLHVKGLDFLFGEFIFPSGMQWFYIAGLGVFATLMQMYLTKAYSATKAGIVGAVSYTNIVFALFLGILMGDSFPDLLGLFGIMLVILGGVLVAKEKR